MNHYLERMESVLKEMDQHFKHGIIPFWAQYGIDKEYGGLFDWLDEKGGRTKNTDKYIVIQTRMIWVNLMEAYTTLAECSGKEIHKRKLNEVIDIILNKMINKRSGEV